MNILKTMFQVWDDDQLSEAVGIIRAEHQNRIDNRTSANLHRLSVGDTVTFEGRKMGKASGKIIKIKRKKAIIDVPSRGKWDVPLSMLSLVSV